jgi:Mrp family chromosome partitioning ATPase
MSKNFELMQQVGRSFEAPSMPQPKLVPPRVHGKAYQGGARLELGQVAREENQRLVQQVFLSQTQAASRVVLFAGTHEGTGCGPICLQVAETLRDSVSGSVCLVEANLRSPSLTSLLGAPNHRGLTDALLQEGPIRSFVKPLQSGNLWFLSCGSLASDSPNLLSSGRIKTRVDELRKEFDYVLVHGPSLTQYTDVTLLGHLTDGLVLVFESNSNGKEAALRVLENLRASRINVLAAVLNKRTFAASR